MEQQNQGVAFVVSAPSGGGKTTLCRRVMERLTNLEFSVSHTTRQPRSGERDGMDYHFTDEARFKKLVDQHYFLEWAHVHGRMYGTSHEEVEKRLRRGIDVLFEIDVQGGRQISQNIERCVLIFVVPPSMGILEYRLRSRQSDPAAEIDRRLQVAAAEIRAATFYTHWIINDHLEHAVLDLESIVRAERLRFQNKHAMMQRVIGGGFGEQA